MTISTELRKAGPFTGNGVTTAFPFSFKVFAASDVAVTRADALGAETGLVLNTDFTVAINADQDAAPGGTVTLAAPLSTGYRLVVSSAVPNLQPTDITNNGGFYPRVIEDALDRHVAQIQQIDEKVKRALKVAITSPLGDQALPAPVAGMLIGWNESNDGLKNYAPIGGTLLGQQLAAAGGSALVGFQQAGAGAVARTVQDKMREWVSVKDFGAVGDGVTDDTAAITAAIAQADILGVDLYWGSGVYRVTSEMSRTFTGPLRWKASGARILFDGAAGSRHVFDFAPGGDVNITGPLTVDGNSKTHIGIYTRNNTDNFYNFVADGLAVVNFRKTLPSITADGVFIDGAWSLVRFTRFTAKNVAMAAGTGVSGISGVRGATVKALSDTRFPLRVEFINPVVEDVFSEDITYNNDQDGLGIFSPEDTAMSANMPDTGMQILVTGGKFKDTMLRAVKIQAQKATITDCDLEITRPINYAVSGVSFDCQTGGGTIENITAVFRNSSVHRTVALINGAQTSGIQPPCGTIRNIKALVQLNSTRTLESIVRISARNTTDGHLFYVSDLVHKGPCSSLVALNPPNGAVIGVVAENLRGAPVHSFVRGISSNPGVGSVVFIRGVMRDVGAAAPAWSTSAGSINNYTVTHADLFQSSNLDTTDGAILRVGSFGLGGITPTWPTADLLDDTSVGPGFYYTGAASNRPASTGTSAWFIHYMRQNNSQAVLQAIGANGTYAGRRFVRAKTGGTWGPWISDTVTSSGSPEGVLTAPVGTLYLRTDGGPGTTLYVKESGSGSTGWAAK